MDTGAQLYPLNRRFNCNMSSQKLSVNWKIKTFRFWRRPEFNRRKPSFELDSVTDKTHVNCPLCLPPWKFKLYLIPILTPTDKSRTLSWEISLFAISKDNKFCCRYSYFRRSGCLWLAEWQLLKLALVTLTLVSGFLCKFYATSARRFSMDR